MTKIIHKGYEIFLEGERVVANNKEMVLKISREEKEGSGSYVMRERFVLLYKNKILSSDDWYYSFELSSIFELILNIAYNKERQQDLNNQINLIKIELEGCKCPEKNKIEWMKSTLAKLSTLEEELKAIKSWEGIK